MHAVVSSLSASEGYNGPPECILPIHEPLEGIPDPHVVAQLSYLGFNPLETIHSLKSSSGPSQQHTLYHKLVERKQSLEAHQRESDAAASPRFPPDVAVRRSKTLEELEDDGKDKLCLMKQRSKSAELTIVPEDSPQNPVSNLANMYNTSAVTPKQLRKSSKVVRFIRETREKMRTGSRIIRRLSFILSPAKTSLSSELDESSSCNFAAFQKLY